MIESITTSTRGPFFLHRLAKQKELELKIASEGERIWGYFWGDYADVENAILKHVHGAGTGKFGRYSDSCQPDCSLSNENFTKSRLKELLELKSDEPVLALDLGGGIGFTWANLARFFEQEIKAGRLALVISNFNFMPDDFFKRELCDLTSEREIFEQGGPFIQYITGPYRSLIDQSIDIPNVGTLPLAGHIDLIHEKLSLTAWDSIPETDLMIVPKLLSAIGTYMVHRNDVDFVSQCSDSDEENVYIKAGLEVAHYFLEHQHNLVKVEAVEDGDHKGEKMNYLFFRTALAPKIQVY